MALKKILGLRCSVKRAPGLESIFEKTKTKHIDMIENIQKRATKQLPGMEELPYEERF